LSEEIEIFKNLSRKIKIFFVKLPEKIEIFRKFAWINWKFFHPDPWPPDFKPDWRRCFCLPVYYYNEKIINAQL